MKYVALYARTSTNKQDTGLEAQLRALEQYCKEKKITNYKIFKDAGISGTKSKRPSLDKMMNAIRTDEVSTVIVYSFSRMARSVKHLLEAMEEFQDRDVDFISISESIDTSTPIGKAMYVIISAISALERDLIAERVKNGIENARAKGKQIGRPITRNEPLIKSLRSKGLTYQEISDLTGFGLATISRVLNSKFPKEK